MSFVVAPRVGPAPPTMTVTVRNPNARPVPLVRFDTPACFARHYLDLSLRRPDGTPATKRPCARTDTKGTPGELAPAAAAVIELPFAELFTGWPAGRYELEVDWNPAVLEAARPGTGIHASMTSLSATSFAIATARSTFRIARGASVALPGGPTLTFRAHGHKRTLEGGPPSPLIIHATLAPASAAPREVSVNVHLHEGRLFWLGELAFELVGHAYNDWMELRYFGPLALD